MCDPVENRPSQEEKLPEEENEIVNNKKLWDIMMEEETPGGPMGDFPEHSEVKAPQSPPRAKVIKNLELPENNFDFSNRKAYNDNYKMKSPRKGVVQQKSDLKNQL